MIALHGDVHWSVVLGFTPDSAQGVATRFAGYDVPRDGPELGDAIGEIVNIVGGSVKRLLAPRALTADLSLPTVITATQFQVILQRKTTSSHVHFDSAVGELWSSVTVGIDPGMIL